MLRIPVAMVIERVPSSAAAIVSSTPLRVPPAIQSAEKPSSSSSAMASVASEGSSERRPAFQTPVPPSALTPAPPVPPLPGPAHAGTATFTARARSRRGIASEHAKPASDAAAANAKVST